jgi:hypothetical protein
MGEGARRLTEKIRQDEGDALRAPNAPSGRCAARELPPRSTATNAWIAERLSMDIRA